MLLIRSCHVQPQSGAGLPVNPGVSCCTGYKLPLTAAGTLGVHRFVEAMKNAFALRDVAWRSRARPSVSSLCFSFRRVEQCVEQFCNCMLLGECLQM